VVALRTRKQMLGLIVLWDAGLALCSPSAQPPLPQHRLLSLSGITVGEVSGFVGFLEGMMMMMMMMHKCVCVSTQHRLLSLSGITVGEVCGMVMMGSCLSRK